MPGRLSQKKEPKNSCSYGIGVSPAHTPNEQKFLLLFSKRSAFLLPMGK
jgi:hypothetical protein